MLIGASAVSPSPANVKQFDVDDFEVPLLLFEFRQATTGAPVRATSRCFFVVLMWFFLAGSSARTFEADVMIVKETTSTVSPHDFQRRPSPVQVSRFDSRVTYSVIEMNSDVERLTGSEPPSNTSTVTAESVPCCCLSTSVPTTVLPLVSTRCCNRRSY